MATHFFDQDKPHGLVKRIILKKFLQAFIPSTLRSGKRALYIDGFAGTGVYGESWPEEIEMFGSPIIALKVAFEHFKKFPPKTETTDFKIFLYFVEKKLKNFNELKKNMKRIFTEYCPDENDYEEHEEKKAHEYTFKCNGPFPIFCKAIKSDFKMFEPPEEMTYRDMKCATFLDPFGVSDTPMEVVRKFSCSTNRSLIINFMSNAVVSFGDKNRENVEQLYGIHSLRKMIKDERPELEKQLDRLNLYMDWVFDNCFQYNTNKEKTMSEKEVQSCTKLYEKLLKYLTQSKHAVTFGIRREKDETFIYHIVFATSDLLCLSHMKEAMNRASNNENSLEMGNYDLVIGGVVLDLANFQDERSLQNEIFKCFKARQRVPIKEINYYVTARTPYVFRKRALKKMMKEENPRITEAEDENGTLQCSRKRGQFPDHTKWFISFSAEQSEIGPVRRSRVKQKMVPYPVTHVPKSRRNLAQASTSYQQS